MLRLLFFIFFFFNDTATTEIYTLSLHDALPILIISCARKIPGLSPPGVKTIGRRSKNRGRRERSSRSEEHTSELQSRLHLVCRLLLEKKKKVRTHHSHSGINACVVNTRPDDPLA